MTASASVYDRLKTLGIELPPVATPAAAYVPFVQTGNLVFLSGHIAKRDGKVWVGQLGLNMDTAAGREAARAVAIDLLGTLHAAVGDLNRIERIVNGIQRRLETETEAEIPSRRVGEIVMDTLKGVDQVAYVRFASVYQNFSEARDFQAFLGKLDKT